MLLQADVNDNDEDEDNNREPPEATSPTKESDPELLIPIESEPESPQKLYPTAPELDESDDASAHSTEV